MNTPININSIYSIEEAREQITLEFKKRHFEYSGRYRIIIHCSKYPCSVVISLIGLISEVGIKGELRKGTDNTCVFIGRTFTTLATKLYYLLFPISFLLISMAFSIANTQYSYVFLFAILYSLFRIFFYLKKIELLHEAILNKIKTAIMT